MMVLITDGTTMSDVTVIRMCFQVLFLFFPKGSAGVGKLSEIGRGGKVEKEGSCERFVFCTRGGAG